MSTNKWLYFRSVTDTDDDDGRGTDINKGTSLMVNADRLVSMQPSADTTLTVHFESVKHLKNHGNNRTHSPTDDRVRLTIAANTHESVMESITEAITSPSGNSFIDVVDLVTTLYDESTRTVTKINKNISNADINIYKTQQGIGMHEYFEVVTPAAGTTDDTNDVVASLNMYLPAQCILLEAAMVTHSLAGSNHGLVALEFHNAAVADDAASGGTEWLGADTLNLTQVEDADDYGGTANTADNVSIPDADLDISSDAIANDTIHTGVADPIDRSTAVTYFHVTAKEDMSSMTGTPKVGVYVRWWGGPAAAL